MQSHITPAQLSDGEVLVEFPPWDSEIVGSNPSRAKPKTVKMVPYASLLGT